RAVRARRRPDGLGPPAVNRRPRAALHLVPRARVELLRGGLARAPEPLLMNGVRRRADDVLRGRPTGQPWGLLLSCGLAYGAAMGSFGGLAGDRAWQLAYSAAKVPLLLLATPALSL